MAPCDRRHTNKTINVLLTFRSDGFIDPVPQRCSNPAAGAGNRPARGLLCFVLGSQACGQLPGSERLWERGRISAPAHCRPPAFHFKPTFPMNLTSSSRRRRRTSLQTPGSALFSLKVAGSESPAERAATFADARQLPGSEGGRVRRMLSASLVALRRKNRAGVFVCDGAHAGSGAANRRRHSGSGF